MYKKNHSCKKMSPNLLYWIDLFFMDRFHSCFPKYLTMDGFIVWNICRWYIMFHEAKFHKCDERSNFWIFISVIEIQIIFNMNSYHYLVKKCQKIWSKCPIFHSPSSFWRRVKCIHSLLVWPYGNTGKILYINYFKLFP